MSGFGRDVLADLLARMAEEQALHDRLKSSRIDNETARMLMAQERFGFAAGRSGAMVTVARDSAALNSEPSRIVEADPVLIRDGCLRLDILLSTDDFRADDFQRRI